jgi:hypothetical protein
MHSEKENVRLGNAKTPTVLRDCCAIQGAATVYEAKKRRESVMRSRKKKKNLGDCPEINGLR